MHVFVLDTNKQPLTPCHPAVARKLLANGKAAVFKRFPLTLILKRTVAEPYAVPLRWCSPYDPGGCGSALALIAIFLPSFLVSARKSQNNIRVLDSSRHTGTGAG